jgi:hypothetical protein
LTNVSRTFAQSFSPWIAGYAIETLWIGSPFIFSGALKLAYDLSLFRTFHNVRPSGENPSPSVESFQRDTSDSAKGTAFPYSRRTKVTCVGPTWAGMDKRATVRPIRASYSIEQVENGWTVSTNDGTVFVFADSKELVAWFCMVVGVPYEPKLSEIDAVELQILKLAKAYH